MNHYINENNKVNINSSYNKNIRRKRNIKTDHQMLKAEQIGCVFGRDLYAVRSVQSEMLASCK